MPKKLIELDKNDQIVLRRAIESAVQKKYPGVKSFAELDRDQRDDLSEAIGLNRQTLETYFNGGELIRCYLSSVNLIIGYIGEPSWKGFVEKNLKEQQTATDSIQTSRLVDLHERSDCLAPDGIQAKGAGPKMKRSRKAALAVVLIFFILTVVIASRKVNSSDVHAQLTVSAVTFVLDAPAEFIRMDAADFIRTDSAILYGTQALDGKRNKVMARAESPGHPVMLEQFHIPAGVQVTVETPVSGQLFIKLLKRSPLAEAQVSGSISRFSDLVINKKTTIAADEIESFTKSMSFKATLRESEVFELALVNPQFFDIPWMVVKDIRFRQKDNFHDAGSASSIIRGRVSFPYIADSVNVQMFDDFYVAMSSPVRMSLMPAQDGLRVVFSGEVEKLTIGSKVLQKPDVNLMPSVYEYVSASVPNMVWQSIGAALTIIATILLQRRWRSGKEKSMNVFVLIIVMFTPFGTHAQMTDAERYRFNTVKVQALEENGSGFICSIYGDSTFVVSANHVVDQAKEPILITFADGQTSTGKIVFQDPAIDLVVIGTRPVNFKWNMVPMAADVELGEQVFYITVLEADWPVLPREAIATIDRWDFDMGFQYASVPGVTTGDSGAALLCDRGIAGIILTQQVKSLDIRVARDRIRAWNKDKWQLTENP